MSRPSGPAEAPRPARRPLALLGAAIAVAAFVAWQVFLHRLVSSDPRSFAAELLIALPVLLFVAWLVSRTRAGQPGGILAFAAGVAGCLAWNRSGTDAILPVLPHLTIYLLLFAWFGASLRAGREPLVTYMARHVHETMSAELLAYTRNVTIAWCVFFLLMAVASLALYAWAPVGTWSAFVNLLNLPLVAAMFVAEYLWRMFRHPDLSRTTIPMMIRSFWKLGSGNGPTPRA
jgi:uncharacterized membrane protein